MMDIGATCAQAASFRYVESKSMLLNQRNEREESD